jgi:hypothetical protein
MDVGSFVALRDSDFDIPKYLYYLCRVRKVSNASTAS